MTKKTDNKKTVKETMFAKAFAYMADGYSVIPVGNDKRPMIKSWKEFQTTAADHDQLEQWFTKDYPNANIGIVTGVISGITVIDVDTYKEKKTDPNIFPKTFTVRTGNGGYQLFYKHNPGMTVSAEGYDNMPGVDIRSDGGYVVAPPSVTKYKDKNSGEWKGGEYTVALNKPLADFPTDMFPKKKPRKTLTGILGTGKGSRNDNIASFSGMLLKVADEKNWEDEVWPAVQRTNKTFSEELPQKELRSTFESIARKELQRRADMIVSPIQVKSMDENGKEVSEIVQVPLRKSGNGSVYKDMANVLMVLSHHPYYKGTIRYNRFRQEIEYNDKAIDDGDIMKIQAFMQIDGQLPGISKDAVYSGIAHYANQNSYDEAQDWLRGLEWDGVERLNTWLPRTTGVPEDDYHCAIGANWFNGMIRRIMEPGCSFDYLLVFVGSQGIGKTGLFRILGGKWYKSYTGAVDNKDFYLALRGALILDLDEGAAMYKSEAIKIKSIITETHDEFRAPYDRVMKKFPRRFVFSMSTNDTEPFRDVTGNRRYWTIDGHQKVDFKWIEENRDQIFAETYHYYKNKIPLIEVPMDKAKEHQERHLPDDSWTDLISDKVRESVQYRNGNPDFSTTITKVFTEVFPHENLARLGKQQEMRIGNIFKNKLGLEKRRERVDGDRRAVWRITDEKIRKIKGLDAKPTTDKQKPLPTEDRDF